MKVVITDSANESLWPIYSYHLEYSRKYAEAFQFEINRFIVDSLSSIPLLGYLYVEACGIRSLIFHGR